MLKVECIVAAVIFPLYVLGGKVSHVEWSRVLVMCCVV